MTAVPESPPPPESRRTLAKGAAILVVARLMSAALGILQVLLISHYFGASLTADAFFVASAVPLIFLGVVESNLGLTFTPLFIELEEKGEASAAWVMAATLFKAGLLLVGGYTLLTMLCALPLAHVLAPGFDGVARRELALLIFCLAPQALAIFVGAVLATMCFIRGAFLLPAAASVAAAAMPCLSLIAWHATLGVYALPLGLVAGAVLAGVLIFPRFGWSHRLFRTPWDLRHPAVKTLGRTILMRTAATSLMEVNTTVDRMFASSIGTGHIAQLSYASRMLVAVRRLFIVPVGRSLMPVLSRAAARGDFAEVRAMVGNVVGVLGVAIIPMFVMVMGFRHEVVSLVFVRGAFDPGSAAFTAQALLLYGLGAFSAILNPVLTATLFAMRDSIAPLRVVTVGVVLNVVCNAAFIWAFGFSGIPLATSTVATVASVLLWRALQQRTGPIAAGKALGSLGRTLLAAGVMLALAKGADLGLQAQGEYRVFLRLLVAGAVGGVAYSAAQAALNPREFRQAVAMLRRGRRRQPA